MKHNKKRKPYPKSPHKWGKSLYKDLDRLCGGKGNEGERKK